MNTTSIEVKEGAAVCWELGNQTDPSLLQAAMGALGITDEVKPRTWKAALKAALQEMHKGSRDDLIRPVKEHSAYLVVHEKAKGDRDNSYASNFTAHVSEAGSVTTTKTCGVCDGKGKRTHFTPCQACSGATCVVCEGEGRIAHLSECFSCFKGQTRFEYEGIDDLRKKTAHFKRVLPASSVGTILTGWIQRNHGMSLRSRGGVYYLPANVMDDWRRLSGAVEAAAMGGTRNEFSEYAFRMTAKTMQGLRKQVVKELATEASVICDEITNSDFSERSLEIRKSRLKDLRRTCGTYQSVLQDALAEVCAVLDHAERMAGSTVAVQEAANVYADVLDI